jgi:hypothetical protein
VTISSQCEPISPTAQGGGNPVGFLVVQGSLDALAGGHLSHRG